MLPLVLLVLCTHIYIYTLCNIYIYIYTQYILYIYIPATQIFQTFQARCFFSEISTRPAADAALCRAAVLDSNSGE